MNVLKSRLTSGYLAVCIAMATVVPQAHAMLVPDTDLLQFQQGVLDNLNRAKEFFETHVVQKMEIDARATAAQQEVDTFNNGFANMIARIDAAMGQLQNIDQEARSRPVQDACRTVGVQKISQEVGCAKDSINDVIRSELGPVSNIIGDYAESLAKGLGLAHNVSSRFAPYSVASGGGSGVVIEKTITEKNLDLFNQHIVEAVERHTAWEEDGKYPADPTLLLMTETIAPVYSPEELEMAVNMAKLSYPEFVRKNMANPANEREVATDLRVKNAIVLGSGIMQEHIALRTAPVDGMPSKMMTMTMPVKLTFDDSGKLSDSGESWIHKVALNEATTPSEISKEALLLKALRTNQMLENFKSQLHREAVILQMVQSKADNFER